MDTTKPACIGKNLQTTKLMASLSQTTLKPAFCSVLSKGSLDWRLGCAVAGSVVVILHQFTETGSPRSGNLVGVGGRAGTSEYRSETSGCRGRVPGRKRNVRDAKTSTGGKDKLLPSCLVTLHTPPSPPLPGC